MRSALTSLSLFLVLLAACQRPAAFGDRCGGDADCPEGGACTDGACVKTAARLEVEQKAAALATTEPAETVRIMTGYADRICAAESAAVADALWIELHDELNAMRRRLVWEPARAGLLAEPTVAAHHEAHPPRPEALVAAERTKGCLAAIRGR